MNTPFFVNDLLEQKYQVFSEKKKGYKCLIDQIDIQSVFRLGKKLLSRILTYTHITLIRPPLRDCRKNNFCYLCVVACKSTDRVYTAFRLSENGRVTHPQSTDKSNSYFNFVCLFMKSEIFCYIKTILMQVHEEYLDIHN